MLSSNLTVMLFVRNEEHRLAETYENFRGLLPVLVVDNESTDRTAALAVGLGLTVVRIPNPGHIEDPDVMRQVQEACPTDYLIVASCAEIIPLALLELYARVASAGSHDVVRAPRISVTAGREIPISSSLARRHPGELRMFRKGAVDFHGTQVHGMGLPTVAEGRILRLSQTREHAFFQFRDYDCSVTERNHGRYDDLWARQRFAAGERFSLPRAMFMVAGRFLRPYFYLGCWRFGMLGLIHCAYRGIMELTVQFRIWEHQSGYTLERVRSENLRIKKSLLDGVRQRVPTP
jgi:hypothetical protein